MDDKWNPPATYIERGFKGKNLLRHDNVRIIQARVPRTQQESEPYLPGGIVFQQILGRRRVPVKKGELRATTDSLPQL